MDLIVQPQDGLKPLLAALEAATKSIDLTIFRLDRDDVVGALGAAVTRGVAVRALIAHTNSGGEKALRKLELKLLERGVTVARSADDFPRYHGKLAIIDRDRLLLLGFNYTKLDLDKSRSFGLIVEDDAVVKETLRLFEADLLKQDYTPRHESLVVSPDNARERLAAFIRGAKSELAIYDTRLSDRAMLRLIAERARAGVSVRVIGRCGKAAPSLIRCEKLPRYRLHIRAIVRDGEEAFVGSQSLRKAELDERREFGMLIAHRPTVRRMLTTFEEDWALTAAARESEKAEAAASA
ncbi:MAG TPA: phospholipase D-like domain-containing protein [Vicinamibacterales bacterium]|nr:phospholipase D-like domain-containing protein [Vicinamibacterales bacterium]